MTPPRSQSVARAVAIGAAAGAAPAHASLFSGDTLDLVANILAWVVLFIAPIIAISVFWIVHILPEKIAEKRHHPQANAIKTLCLLSLFFGGLLWPLAWLWAYSKPVFYKQAYGTDKLDHDEHVDAEQSAGNGDQVASLRERLARLEGRGIPASELHGLRADLDALEAKLAREAH